MSAAPAIATAISLLPALAAAHGIALPKQTRVVVELRRLLVVVRYAIPAGIQAKRLRKIFDRDRDGRLDATEEAHARRHLGRLALLHLEVKLNGITLEARVQHVATLGLEARVGTAGPVYASVVAELLAPWRAGANRLSVMDRHPDRSIAVPLTLFVSPPLVLQASSLGKKSPDGRALEDVLLREGMTAEVTIEAPRL